MIQSLRNRFFNNNCIHKMAMIARGVSLKNTKLEAYANIAHNAELIESRIGKRSSIGRYTKIRYADVGTYCAVSWDVTIGADQHPTNRISGSAAFFQKRFGLVNKNSSKGEVAKTIVGNDVLIGCNSVIKSGVIIGTGAIIGAGAVVLNDVQPFEIVGGVPAKHIGWRFDEAIRGKLIETKWWEWDDGQLKDNIALFQSDNIADVIEQLLVIEKNGK